MLGFIFKSSAVPWEKEGVEAGRGNLWTRLEAERERKERKEEDGSNFLGKHIVLFGLPGSVPGAQLKVNFSYWIPSRDIITSKGYYYPAGFRWNHLCVTLEMQGVTIVIWQHGTCQASSFQGEGDCWHNLASSPLQSDQFFCFSGFFFFSFLLGRCSSKKTGEFHKNGREQQQK